MYKLALADLPPDDETGGGSAVFTEDNFSGGVFLPVAAGGQFYYRGAFNTGDRLMRYPGGNGNGNGEDSAALSGVHTTLRLEPWEARYRDTAQPERAESPAPTTERPAGPLPESKPYRGLAYLNPLKFWLPLPLIRGEIDPADGTARLAVTGGGILTYMADPVEANRITLFAYFDARSLMGIFDLQWINYSFGFPLSLSFSDDIDKTLTRSSTVRRDTVASLGAVLRTGLGGESLWASFQPQAQVQLSAFDPGDNSNPYTWKYEDPLFAVSAGITIATLRKANWEIFGSGVSATARGIMALKDDKEYAPRVEGLLQAAFEFRFFPLRLRLYGVRDNNLMNLAGDSTIFTSPLFSDMASSEYLATAPVQKSLEWLAGGEAETGLFALDIQNSLSHIYFNRITGTLASRGAFYRDAAGRTPEGDPLGNDFALAQSLAARLSLTVSTVALPMQPFALTFTGISLWKISGLRDGFSGDDFSFSYTLSITLP
jgi:hypothetical protein